MPLRPPELLRTVLRAGGDALAAPAIQALLARAQRDTDQTWVLLVDLGPGRYGTVTAL
jgi:hypothetical protein